jgi:hypothetical protein
MRILTGLVVLMALMAGVALGQLQVTLNTSVISDYSNVAVSWSGAVSFNPSTDYITVFSPPLADPLSTVVMLNSSMLIVNGTLLADWSQNGGASGSFSAGLVNNRLSYQFCYFRLKTQTQPFMGISLACSSMYVKHVSSLFCAAAFLTVPLQHLDHANEPSARPSGTHRRPHGNASHFSGLLLRFVFASLVCCLAVAQASRIDNRGHKVASDSVVAHTRAEINISHE